jgi:hypothetical protein
MRKFSVITGLFSFFPTITAFCLGASQGNAGGEGPGPFGFFLSVSPFLFILAVIVLMVLAIIRDVRAIKRGEDVNLAIVALILTILLAPIGIIISFAAIKKG